jgi:hypothetical protein
MLERLLEEIRRGGTLPPAVLAARLGESTGMVEMMLEDLERRGRLRRLDNQCGSACGGCSVADSCLPNGGAKSKVWMLID